MFQYWVVLVSLVFFPLPLFDGGDLNICCNRFGWTGFSKDIHWLAPTASGVVTGFGILCIFLQCFNYLIDTYLML